MRDKRPFEQKHEEAVKEKEAKQEATAKAKKERQDRIKQYKAEGWR